MIKPFSELSLEELRDQRLSRGMMIQILSQRTDDVLWDIWYLIQELHQIDVLINNLTWKNS
jgi:hypothetical protein